MEASVSPCSPFCLVLCLVGCLLPRRRRLVRNMAGTLNLQVLQRLDSSIYEIIDKASYVAQYDYVQQEWVRGLSCPVGLEVALSAESKPPGSCRKSRKWKARFSFSSGPSLCHLPDR